MQKDKTTNTRSKINDQINRALIKKAPSLLVSISDDISLVKNTLGVGGINMCELFLRCKCIQSQDARAKRKSHTCIYWKAGRGRVGIWHCAAYYPRMHEMPCHLQTGHARSTLSLLLRCWCCTSSSQPHSCMFRAFDRARSNSLVSRQMRQMHLFNNAFKQLSKILELQMMQPVPSPYKMYIPLQGQSQSIRAEIIHRVDRWLEE